MGRKCKVFIASACFLIGLELIIFYIVGDEPIPPDSYPFRIQVVYKPPLYNDGRRVTTTQGPPERKLQDESTTTQMPSKEIICEQNTATADEFFKISNRPINKLHFNVIMNIQKSCHDEAFLLVVVHSRYNNSDKRRLIRDTWGSVANGKKWPGFKGSLPKIELVFLLGLPHDGENAIIYQENSWYGDIIQFNFIDDYRNMTYKNLMGLHWIMQKCSNVPYILKTDDDIIANIPAIVNMLQRQDYKRTIIGPFNPQSATVRDPTSKWFLTCSQYPFDILPPYMSGSGYILSRDLVSDLFKMSSFVPLIHIDDVYVTGILGYLLHVEYAYSAGGFTYAEKTPPTLESMVRDDVYTRGVMCPQAIRDLWEALETYEPPSRLRADTILFMFFAIVLVGLCFACMCVLEMDNIEPVKSERSKQGRYYRKFKHSLKGYSRHYRYQRHFKI